MRKSLGCLVVGLALFLNVQPVYAQTNVEYQILKKDMESLKEGQAGLKKDLQELKKLIQSRPQGAAPGGPPEFKEAMINIKGAPINGDKIAKLVLLEFSDYQ